MLTLLICSKPVKDQYLNERTQGVAGSRPIAPLGPPASVRSSQRTEPLLKPAPPKVRVADNLTRGSVPMVGRWKSPKGLPGRSPDSRWRSDLVVRAHLVWPAAGSSDTRCRVPPMPSAAEHVPHRPVEDPSRSGP
jgi:hypothetical protein